LRLHKSLILWFLKKAWPAVSNSIFVRLACFYISGFLGFNDFYGSFMASGQLAWLAPRNYGVTDAAAATTSPDRGK
jgi:hypothetical protein